MNILAFLFFLLGSVFAVAAGRVLFRLESLAGFLDDWEAGRVKGWFTKFMFSSLYFPLQMGVFRLCIRLFGDGFMTWFYRISGALFIMCGVMTFIFSFVVLFAFNYFAF